MTQQTPSSASENPWDEFLKAIETEYEQTSRSMKEVSLMLEQSQIELNKLNQRNASITSHLQQVQAQFDTIPRQDIRVAYNAALDAQQRLLVMRGQLDKLQNDHDSLKRYHDLLSKVRAFIAQDLPRQAKNDSHSSGSAGSTTVEMVVKA
jgi:two-component system sensor histidine kinase DegS